VTIFTGIFSAALFPSLTSYLARGRDTSRISGIKEISTAIAAYGIDKQGYPAVPESGCIPSKDLSSYIIRIPKDPILGRISTGCDGSDGMTYVYRILENNQELPTVIIQADLENSN
jgi:type II secretory pathway pseudopilin PulG